MSGLLLIGGGGHCLTVIDAVNRMEYDDIGIVDKRERIGQTVCGVPIVGCDAELSALRAHYQYAFVAVGSIGNWRKRMELLHQLESLRYEIHTIIHPRAIIGSNVNLSCGVLVGPGAMVNALSNIEKMCILNTGCIVEHQCEIGAYAHIAPGVVLCGAVRIGRGAHIGAGSVIKQEVSIGENVVVGIGSVVDRDIPDNVVAFGNPCRPVRPRDE